MGSITGISKKGAKSLAWIEFKYRVCNKLGLGSCEKQLKVENAINVKNRYLIIYFKFVIKG